MWGKLTRGVAGMSDVAYDRREELDYCVIQ